MDLNHRPIDYESTALTAELRALGVAMYQSAVHGGGGGIRTLAPKYSDLQV